MARARIARSAAALREEVVHLLDGAGAHLRAIDALRRGVLNTGVVSGTTPVSSPEMTRRVVGVGRSRRWTMVHFVLPAQ